MTLRHCLASHAHTTPSAPALLAPGSSVVTYADLSHAVVRAQAWLASNGLGADARIAVCLPQGMALAMAALAVGCNATVVALHPGLTEPELAVLLADARTDAVLGLPDDPRPARLARQQGITSLAFDLERLLSGPTEMHQKETGTHAAPLPDDTAFVLFTSGTTGQPKRVPLTHRQILASAFNIARHLALTPDDRGLCLMPLFHSHGLVGGLLAPLAAGSSVVCTPGFDGAAFMSWIAGSTPTWYTAAPTIHRAIADLADEANGVPSTHALRFIRSASSALPPELQQRLEHLWGVPVIESYGMTESATQMASNPLPPGLRKPGSVGLPAGATLRVVDDDGIDQPAGKVGSIVARGPVVFTGYEDMLARIDDPRLPVTQDSVLVLAGCGPAGVPGMPEWGMVPVPAKLVRAGVTDMVRVTDARMSGTSFGTVLLHAAPEAAAGGPLGLVADGDMISVDVPAGRLDLEVGAAELAARRARRPPPPPVHLRGWPALYARHVMQAPDGCDLDFLRAPTPAHRRFIEPVIGRS